MPTTKQPTAPASVVHECCTYVPELRKALSDLLAHAEQVRGDSLCARLGDSCPHLAFAWAVLNETLIS